VPYPDTSGEGFIDPRTLSLRLDELLPTERVIGVDSGNFMGYPSMFLSVPDEQGFCFTQAFQSIGLGLATAIGAARLHHVSSIAVAGRFKGQFTEEMFAEGQDLDHPYFSTKYEAERIVRDEASVPWRVYRPGMVIGSSETGEADRIGVPHGAVLDEVDRVGRRQAEPVLLAPDDQ
jgi:hypothetical protein